MSARQPVRVGVIGAGLMGKELAGALGRWSALSDSAVDPQLTAVCDVNAPALDWFRRVSSVRTLTDDYRNLLDGSVDVLYVAVPHHLHESLYLDIAAAGVDFLGEKPFGIDPGASAAIGDGIAASSAFVRCSSEMPFYPGAQQAISFLQQGRAGRIIEANFAFLHSSDLNVDKPINWKRQTQFCGQIGVMGDLGMHVTHVPLRLGWQPSSVFAQLQDLVPTRPDGKGGVADCDTIENATLCTRVTDPLGDFPLTLETKRIAPGEMNTWRMRVVGMDGGVEFSTRYPASLKVMTVRDGQQVWEERMAGSQSAQPTITGGIFEFGFTDALLQMWAAYFAERAGELGDAFGCATPAEALASHDLFDAALRSSATGSAVPFTSGTRRRHVASDVAGVIGRA
ncbi:Predicted dehydrogenase [Nakamurella panacisegetis]|uniref:Predicted dehydrogenase n=1 Tax=Nakamurella panacisegetis TaxID=1090615 RepID=A0A1H0K826_9ACTN|nr:Gfo/Idh/MocA family oxidoreductase [Nakamurella panacisegetis]SDO51922.1 Predicted dehydrogenase [Nakamurella panacisegetis]